MDTIGEAGAQVLATKLYIPAARPGLVSRPHLMARLNAGLERKLTLVSAPAGFGKSTLLSAWAGAVQPPTRVAWVSLDEGDNDPARFLAYAIASLQTIDKGIGRALLGALQSPQPPALEELLTALINQIGALADDAGPRPRVVLVLDDYHLIAAQPIHDALAFLLDHLPGNMHLVISTRADPPLPIARLRGCGELSELRLSDLRFSLEEAAGFLNRMVGSGLARRDVELLAARTEGWIAGLQMAATSLQGRSAEQIARFVQAFTGSNRHILDYLVEQILDRQPPGVRAFLLQTAILDRLTAPLCDAVTGQEDSEAALEGLEKANLFVIALDDDRRWFRYHHLFADLLRKRLQQELRETVPTLHRRASEWYERSGLVIEAVDHALAAKDDERAARLIAALAESLWGQGEQATLLRWLEALPDGLLRARPRLCALHALALLMAGRSEAAESRLQAAEGALAALSGRGDAEPPNQRAALDLEGAIAAAHAFQALFRGAVAEMIQYSERALACLPAEGSMWRGSVLIVLGDAYGFSGDLAAAHQAYTEAMQVSRAAGNTYFVLMAGAKLAANYWRQGRLRQVAECCEQQWQMIEENGFTSTPRAAGLLLLWANVLQERNAVDQALQYVNKALEQSAQGDNVAVTGLGYLTLAAVLLARGEAAGAEEAIRKLDRLAEHAHLPIWISSGAVAVKARLWMGRGQLDAAAQLLLQERRLTAQDTITYTREAEYHALARLLVAQNRLPEALGLLERLLHAAGAQGRSGSTIQALVRRAMALLHLSPERPTPGDTAQALASLERALHLAEPEGYVGTFVAEGPPMARLLHEAARRGIAADYAGRLLAVFAGHTSEAAPAEAQSSPAASIEPLREREIEVLGLIAQGLSNQEIAQRLCLSLPTIKWHTSHILGKLGVANRTQAVARARKLGILPT